jgi:hypothetical protein
VVGRWVGHVQVEVALDMKDRAGIAAAHGHDHISGAYDVVCEGFRICLSEVDSSFSTTPTHTPRRYACRLRSQDGMPTLPHLFRRRRQV